MPKIIEAVKRYGAAELKSPLGKIDLLVVVIVLMLTIISPFWLPYLNVPTTFLNDIFLEEMWHL